jgi:hypothetical protein
MAVAVARRRRVETELMWVSLDVVSSYMGGSSHRAIVLDGRAPCSNFSGSTSSTLGSSGSIFCSYGSDATQGILSDG